jgi:hypothetical protein
MTTAENPSKRAPHLCETITESTKERLFNMIELYQQQYINECKVCCPIQVVHFMDEETSLKCLKVLHESGDCDWKDNDWITRAAARQGKLRCLKYAYENGVSFHKDCKKDAELSKHTHVLRYLDEQNFDTHWFYAR